MLDRVSTEVLRLIMQHVSPSVWERKECLTQLGIVCVSIRRAIKPIADEYVHVDRTDAVAVIKRWPTACRKAVTTLLIGYDGTNTESTDALQIDERDLTRLLGALPAVKAVYVRNLAAKPLPPDGVRAEAVAFATAQNNPFRNWVLKLIQAGSLETSTPLLFTYDESLIAHAPSPEIPGLKYIRLAPGHPHDILNTLEALPDLEAVFFAGAFTYRTGRLGEIDFSGEKEIREYLDTSNFVVIRPQKGDIDGVEPAFSRYIRSRA